MPDVILAQETIVGRLRSCSSSINNYMIQETYIRDADCPEAVTESFIVNKCLEILLDELKSIGIIPSLPIEDLSGNTSEIDKLILVRRKLDIASLYKLCTMMPIDFLTDIGATIEVHREHVSEISSVFGIVVDKIVDRMLPGSNDWVDLRLIQDSVYSTSRFLDHIEATIEKIKSSGEPSVINDINIDVISAYISSVTSKQLKYGSYIDRIVTLVRDGKLNSVIKTLDTELLLRSKTNNRMGLLSSTQINILARASHELADASADTQLRKMAKSIVSKYKHRTEFYPEYYLTTGTTPTLEQHALVVAQLLSQYSHESITAAISRMSQINTVSNNKFKEQILSELTTWMYTKQGAT